MGSLWKDTVMLYLSKCQKEMIWRRLFIIFKDIQLNHWNAGIKQLANEVVLYYERIDFEYWKKLKLEYEDSVNAETQTNGCIDVENIENVLIVVPKTLVPQKYNDANLKKLNAKKNKRMNKYKQMREIAMKNKIKFDKEIESKQNEDDKTKQIEENQENENNENTLNGDIKHNEDENIEQNNIKCEDDESKLK